MKKYLLIILATILLSGCGFRLRGQLSGNLEGVKVYLNADNFYGFLSVDLKRQLSLLGAELISSGELTDQPAVSIYLSKAREKSNTLSVDKNGRPVEYELIMDVDVDIHRLDNKQSEEPQWTTMHVRRVQVYDNNLLLAKARERDEVRQEMRRILVSQIIERMRVYAP